MSKQITSFAGQDFSQNPLYHPPEAPNFAAIRPEHVQAIEAIIAENRQAVEDLLAQSVFSWENFVLPLERMENRLSKAFSPISHLQSVCSSEQWRKAYEKVLPLLSEYGADMAQHSGLYAAFKSIREGAEFATLNASQQKIIVDALEDFERSGVALSDEDKATFKALTLKLSELTTQFANHVLDATNAWQLHLTDAQRLQGLPESTLALLADLARQRQLEGYVLTLDAPVVIAVLTYANERALRREVYEAYSARASDRSDEGRFDNQNIIQEILSLRQQKAQLLGFEDYAALSLDVKMAKSPQAVMDFIEDLLAKSKSKGEQEMAEVRAYAKTQFGLERVEPWDVAFVSEALQQDKFSISQEQLRAYFPIDKVLEGLFWVAQTLFAVRFRPNETLSVWHKDVLAFDVLDEGGQLLAQFYLDLYARAQKRGGAWMDGAVSRFKDGAHLQLPVAYLVCNFTPAVGDAVAHLTHDEVTTLFHEFGHGLHHMLTQVEYYSLSGINGVEWDAVEQPSQFMENFCYTPEGLAALTRHQQSGEVMPEVLVDKLVAAKNFQSAMALLRQLEFALFDLQVHSKATAGQPVLEILQAVRAKVAVTPEYEHNRFPMQFSHIFAGGYAAGYYSYKWAEVLSADSFAAFEEEGVFNPKTGARFRKEILAVGSSRSSMESFKAFRGREPSVEALLRHSAIVDERALAQ